MLLLSFYVAWSSQPGPGTEYSSGRPPRPEPPKTGWSVPDQGSGSGFGTDTGYLMGYRNVDTPKGVTVKPGYINLTLYVI